GDGLDDALAAIGGRAAEDQHAVRWDAGGEKRIELSAVVAVRADRQAALGAYGANRVEGIRFAGGERAAEDRRRVRFGQHVPIGGDERVLRPARERQQREQLFRRLHRALVLPRGEGGVGEVAALLAGDEQRRLAHPDDLGAAEQAGRAQAVEDWTDRRAAPVVGFEAEATPLRWDQQIDQRVRHRLGLERLTDEQIDGLRALSRGGEQTLGGRRSHRGVV